MDYPTCWDYTFSFTPRSVREAKNLSFILNKKCYGVDLTRLSNEEIWEKRVLISIM